MWRCRVSRPPTALGAENRVHVSCRAPPTTCRAYQTRRDRLQGRLMQCPGFAGAGRVQQAAWQTREEGQARRQTTSGVSTASPGENGASAPGLGGKGAGGRGLLGADPGWGDAPAAARSALEAEGDTLVCPKGPREGHGSRAKGPRPGLPNRGSASAIAPGSSSATLEGPLSCFPPSLRTRGV